MASDPDQIRGSIEQTQQHLSADIDALAEKVSPPRIVERRVQQTRSAMTSLKDSIMGSTADATGAVGGTAGSAAGSAKDAASSAQESVAATISSAADMAGSAPEQARRRTRGNPLAAGLIVFGAGWLLASVLPATEREQQAAAQLKNLAVDKGGSRRPRPSAPARCPGRSRASPRPGLAGSSRWERNSSQSSRRPVAVIISVTIVLLKNPGPYRATAISRGTVVSVRSCSFESTRLLPV